MTKIFLPLLLLVALSSMVHADSGSASDMNGNSTGPSMGRSGKRGGGKRINPDAGGKHSGTIHGSCGTIASPSNPLAGACVNIELILNDEKGAEALRTRTTQNGLFEFAAEKGKSYRVVSGSKFYDVVSPKDPVPGGATIELQLQQK